MARRRPLDPSDDELRHDPPVPAGFSPLRGRVLVAEDANNLRRLYVRVLTGWGLACEAAEDGRATVELARRQSFDAFVIDRQMPAMDGLEATRALRGLGISRPIVMVTAVAPPGTRKHCLQAGVDLLLLKPVDFEDLYRFLGPRLGASAEALGNGGPAEDLAAGGDVELAALVSGFAQGLPEKVARLESALEAKDWSTLNAETHKLVGAAGTYGLDEVYEAAETLENAGREEDADTAELALERLAGATRAR